MKIKFITSVLALLLAYAANACWYSKSNYTDYIFSVNDQQTIETNYVDGVLKYKVTNNKVVDFPLTVSMKLISNEEIIIQGGSSSTAGELIKGKLQYRVLPGGNWVTVSEYETPSGTISKESEPATYFGRNNIWPRCNAGDVIMIRLYVTDGMWQSGDLKNKCADKLTTVSTTFGNKTTLPNAFEYLMDGVEIRNMNLGGSWVPHLVTTVIYSGKTRPLK